MRCFMLIPGQSLPLPLLATLQMQTGQDAIFMLPVLTKSNKRLPSSIRL